MQYNELNSIHYISPVSWPIGASRALNTAQFIYSGSQQQATIPRKHEKRNMLNRHSVFAHDIS